MYIPEDYQSPWIWIVIIESSYFYTDYVLSLLNFTANFWIVRWMANARSHNISKNENKFVNPPHDADLLQNLMVSSLTHAIPFLQVSWKSGW